MLKQINTDDANFNIVINSAIRYAIGRKTYVPKAVIDFVTPLLSDLSTLALESIEKDIKLNYENSFLGNSEIDKPIWLKFLAKVRNELDKRKEENG